MLVFFVGALTSKCTKERCVFRDHVRIVAPVDVRVKRIMKSEGLSQEYALKLIEDNDKAQAEYLQRFYYINSEDPTIYDRVLNTGKMNFDTAKRVIVKAASQAW